MGGVIIGVDPHKASVTIEVRDRREVLRATGRFPTNKAGYQQLLAYVRQWPARTWAVEGAHGVGRPLASRLLAGGETVLDVPAKPAARVRVFDTGQGRKTDATDAHAVAMVALRTRGLRQLVVDEDLAVLRLLADRRDELSRARTQTLNRLHRLLAELIPGGAGRHLTALQAKALLAAVRPRDLPGRTRREFAVELAAEVQALDGKLKTLTRRLAEVVTAAGSGLMDVYGIGPAGAARILADVGDVARFADRNRFASWTGTAPLDASSGAQIRHRLSRAGNRRLNHVLYIAAVCQIRHDTPGRTYYRRKLAEGKTTLEALRCLRRRLSDVVYRQLVTDAATNNALRAGPGGHSGATLTSSAAGPTPAADSSDKPLPGPAPVTLPPAARPTPSNCRRPSGVSLGLFSVAGTGKALDHGLAPVAAACLGVTTAAGGGVLRDVLVREVPALVRAGSELYAVPALAGALVVGVAATAGADSPALGAGVATAICAVRLLALRYHWHGPRARGARSRG